MGRMFRIITEGPIEAVTAGAALAHSVETEPFVSGGAPYIEVGGPKAVFHTPAARTVPIEQTPPPVKPREYLSASLQDVATPSPIRLAAISSDVVAFHHPNHAVSAEYRELSHDLRRQLATIPGSKAVLFSAAGRDRGTTTVVLNLAVTIAKETGDRVLVIAADRGSADAAVRLGAAGEPGLADVIAQSTPLAWAVQPTPIENLHALGSGRGLDDSGLTAMPQVIVALRQWYDWILIDGGTADERVLSANDAVYLVTRKNETVASTTRQQIARNGGLLRGIITTHI